ncbi:MAG: FAD-dependent monooxygenase [Xanthomonadales bacterium]|nr:FAD-dependent monooxygenase [Xanthomonadales bacterium]
MRANECDILIAGGGLVGLSLGLALSGSGLRVRLVDQAPVDTGQQPADERHLALNEVSCRILTHLGVLPALGAAAAPIRAIHVSSAGEFGVTHWSAAENGRERFGVVVPARRLLQELRQAVLTRSDVELVAPASVQDVLASTDHVSTQIAAGAGDQSAVSARLLVIADGAESALRTAAGIGAERHDYQRSAICCALTPERDHQGTAYERFTRSGPVALLPQAQGRCGAIFVVETTEVARLMALDQHDYLAELQQAFGYRLGRLRDVGLRVSYPLRRMLAERLIAPRQVLIGNAAQAVHPVGAQGFNLGLRDAAALAQALLQSHRQGADPGAPSLLDSYAAARQADRAATTGLSHALALSTGMHGAAAGFLRSLALIAADRFEPLREHLLLGGMGYRGHTPALARGVMP